MSSGYVPPRWTQSLIVMLEKNPSVIIVHKLRAIILLEADFNFANKLILGMQMMNNAEELGLVVPEALGSRKAHNSLELALDCCLTIDLSRLKLEPIAVTSVDAAQCYNCITHPPGSLACQRLGTPPLFLSCMLRCIQLMRFHLRTAYGDSEEYFGGIMELIEVLTQGICQGNGAGPSFWYAVSIILVNMLHHKGHGVQFLSALTNKLVKLAGLLFVDDQLPLDNQSVPP
jgi:hypothetical protein